MENEIVVPVKIDGLDEALEKARRLRELLKEAKSLANDIASLKIRSLKPAESTYTIGDKVLLSVQVQPRGVRGFLYRLLCRRRSN